MAMRLVSSETPFTLAARTATASSGPIANSGAASGILVCTHVTAASGTTPTLVVSVETSANGTSGWTAVTGSAATQLTAAGNAISYATVEAPFVRVVATIGGTTPSFTFETVALVLGD